MDIDPLDDNQDVLRESNNVIESELVVQREREIMARPDVIRDTQQYNKTIHQVTPSGGEPTYLPEYGSSTPVRKSPDVPAYSLAGRAEEAKKEQHSKDKEHDSYNITSPFLDHVDLKSNENLDASGNGGKSRYAIQFGDQVDLDIGRLKEEAIEGQRNNRISINDLLTQSPHPHSAVSTPNSISPATPDDHQLSDQHYQPGSIHSPVPLPLRPRSSFSSTARPISNRRPGPIHTTSRSRASPYHLTSATRYEGTGLGINMMNSPSTSGEIHSLSHSHSNSPPGPAQSPGSMSARRRKAPEWPEPKSARSHSFTSASTPRDMYQTLKTPSVLRVPTTAQLLSRPGDVHSPMLIPGSASGIGPIRRGIPASSAPPLSANRIDAQSPQFPATPRRVHLLDVPRAKVISTLNERAGKYWFDPSTSDCRIYIPVPPKKAGPLTPDILGESSGSRTSKWPPAPDAPKHIEGMTREDPNVVNTRYQYQSRKGSQPDQEELPVLVFHVHRDYLVTQSNLLRSLLTATSPTRPTFPQSPTTPQARSFPAPVLRMPKGKTIRGSRVLPQRDGEPISVYMPIPDPASFGLVLHWLYWGDTPTLERALSQGLATWQGVVKNIEYLALDDSIKRVIGKWWRTWVKTDVGRKSESINKRPSVSDTEASKRTGRGYSVESESTDEGREEEVDGDVDGMEVDLKDGQVIKEEDDGGVGDLLKKL